MTYKEIRWFIIAYLIGVGAIGVLYDLGYMPFTLEFLP